MSEAVQAPATPSKGKKVKSGGAKKVRAVPNHPPISEMVNTAIAKLNERGGSSAQAIKKYIAGNYKVDVERLAPFIRKYLKSGVSNGSLHQTKGKGASGSFKVAKPVVSAKPKVAKKPKTPKAPKSTTPKPKKVVKKKASGEKPAKPKKPKKVKPTSPKKAVVTSTPPAAPSAASPTKKSKVEKKPKVPKAAKPKSPKKKAATPKAKKPASKKATKK